MRTITQRLSVVAMLLLGGTCAHAEVIELEGKVKAVDADARTISIERKTAKVTKTLDLEVNKKAGDLSSVKVGDEISFSYDPVLELVTKIKSDAEETRKPAEAATSSNRKRVFGDREEEICRQAVQKLEKEHYLQRKIDGDVTSQMFDTFLRSLDPMKMYLLQSDVESFSEDKSDLPRQLKSGDLSLFRTVFDRFLSRVDAVQTTIEQAITASHDFTKDESIATDADSAVWLDGEEAAKDNWRKRIKYDLLVKKLDGIKDTDARDALLRRYESFASRMHSMSTDELLEVILNSLASSFDPQSAYMSPETLRNWEIGMRLQLDGIGASLKVEDGYVTVAELVPGGAAAKDGRLKQQDRIIGVGQGDTGDMIDVENMKLNDVVDLIRGKRGTVIRLKVLPGGRSPSVVYTLTREQISLVGSEIRGEVFEVRSGAGGKPSKVGVVVVPSFYSDMAAMRKGDKDYKSVSRDCKALLDGFRLQNVECVVLDIRNNGGGSIQETIGMTGLFLDKGRIGQIKDKDGNVQQLNDEEAGGAWGGPLVLLVNKATAGGGEILAGAIQDHYRGLVVGDEATMGKAGSATLMSIEEGKEMGSLKVTTSCFYRPSGEGFQQRGVKSDIVLPSLTGFSLAGEGPKGALAFDRIPKAGFQPAGRENEAKMNKLRRQSEARVKKSEDFQKIVRAIEQQEKRKRDGRISLVETEFEKHWKESPEEAARSSTQRNGIVRDYYLDEVLNIAADFAKEVKSE